MAPDYGGGYYEMGVLDTLLGDFSKAKINFEKAREIWPDNVRTHIGLLTVYADESDFENLIETLTTLIDLVEDEAETLEYLECRWILLPGTETDLRT